jgi:hypothetical protein
VDVVAIVSSWAALAGALLSIGIELYRALKPRRAGVEDTPPTEASYADRWRLTRGVTVLSIIPIFALILASNGLGLYSDLFFFGIPVDDQGDALPATVDQLHNVQIGNFIRLFQGVVIVVFVFLLLRFFIHYFVRVGEAWEKASS